MIGSGLQRCGAILLLAMPLVLAVSAAETASHESDAVFRKLAQFERQGSLTKEKIEVVLGAQFSESPPGGTIHYYHLSTAQLGAAAVFKDADLRVNLADDSFILILKLPATCLNKTAVFARFPGMTITNYPHGHSFNEETSWSARRNWVNLTFGFAEHTPDCLSSIVLTSSD